MADYKNSRIYREIMREAILLGDNFLVDMVLMRLANLTRSSTAPGTNSNIISFPNQHLVTIPTFRKSQNVWVTALLATMIPFGIVLLLMACHYFSLYGSVACPT
jgi:hypothetical protein